MIHNKIQPFSPDCPQPSIALQMQNHGLKHHSFHSIPLLCLLITLCVFAVTKPGMVEPPPDPDKQRRTAERGARRARRKRQREAFQIRDHEDGMSTDDELKPSEISSYNSEKGGLGVDRRQQLHWDGCSSLVNYYMLYNLHKY